MRHYWSKSSTGRDQSLTQELDQGNWSLLTLSLVIEKYVLPTVPTTGAIFKDVTSSRWIKGVEM